MGQAISLTDMLYVVHGRPYVDVFSEQADENESQCEDAAAPKPSKNRVSEKKVVIVVPSSKLRIRAGDS